MSKPRIARSIWVTVTALLVSQATIYVAVCLGFGLSWPGIVWFVPAVVGTHAALGLILVRLRNLFTIVGTDTVLDRVNVANILSMIRVSSAPTLLWLILIAPDAPIAPILVTLTAIVFLTDLADGQVARRTGQITAIGKYLDSSSDYAILLLISAALIAHGFVSTWFFVIVMVRLLVQAVGQVALFVRQGGQIESKNSFLGKASVFAMMFAYAFSLLQLVRTIGSWFWTSMQVVEYVGGAIILVSLVEKIRLFVVEWRATSAQPQ